MKKLLPIALALLAMLVSSCKKNTHLSEEIETKLENYTADIPLSVLGATAESTSVYPVSATYSYLGYGYDVTEKFEDVASVRANIVDIAAFVSNYSDRYYQDRSTQGYWRTFTAINAKEFSSKFSSFFKETQGLNVFGKTIEAAFPNANVTDKKYIYGYYANIFERDRIGFTGDAVIKNSLNANFINDTKVLSATELVKKYGTHLLIKIRRGTRFNVIYQSEIKDNSFLDRNSVAMEGLRYAIKKVYFLSTGYLDEPNLKNLNGNVSAKIYYYSMGGDFSEIKINNATKIPTINLTDWWNSSNENNYKFIGATEDGLLPLYELIEDDTKQAELKSYILKYLTDKSVKS